MSLEDLKTKIDKLNEMMNSVEVEAAAGIARNLWKTSDGQLTLGAWSTGAGMALQSEDQTKKRAAEILQTAAIQLTKSADFTDKNIGLNIMQWMYFNAELPEKGATYVDNG